VFGEFQGAGIVVLDILRWISMVWLVIGIGWLVQIAVITRTLPVSFLATGLSLSLFVDMGSQFARLGQAQLSYQLPVVYFELVMISVGMYFYVRDNENIKFIPPFYFFLRYRSQKGKKNPGGTA